MTYLRLLNIQGIAGLAVSVCLALLLVIQRGDTRHWRKQSGQFEQLYRGEQASFAGQAKTPRGRVQGGPSAPRRRSTGELTRSVRGSARREPRRGRFVTCSGRRSC